MSVESSMENARRNRERAEKYFAEQNRKSELARERRDRAKYAKQQEEQSEALVKAVSQRQSGVQIYNEANETPYPLRGKKSSSNRKRGGKFWLLLIIAGLIWWVATLPEKTVHAFIDQFKKPSITASPVKPSVQDLQPQLSAPSEVIPQTVTPKKYPKCSSVITDNCKE